MGQFYLHTNGSLIYKPHGGVEYDSPFVKRVWEDDYFETPQAFTKFLTEAVRAGANKDEVDRLILNNNLTSWVPGCREKIYG